MKSARFVHLAICCGLLTTGAANGQTIDDLFDDSSVQEIRIRMDPADWQTLHDKYLENTYYRCTVQWRNLVLENVGMKSRGSGSRNPIKPALALDFGHYASAQRFLSLKSVILRNFAEDPSMIHELLAEKMFARMGLPYSREAYAKLYINDQYVGLHMLVEPIDKRFLASRFGEDQGYLYEFNLGETPYHFEYLGDDPNLYVPGMFEPKTHEDQPDAEFIVRMVRAINETPDRTFVETVGNYLPIDAFLAHMAVEQFIAEPDGILGHAGMTNFYLYRRIADNRFVFLVWDKDASLYAGDRSVLENADQNVLMRRLMAVPELKQRFFASVWRAAEIAGGEGGWLEAEANRAHSQIADAVRADPNRVCLEEDVYVRCSMEVFEASSEYTMAVIRDRARRAKAELAASNFRPSTTTASAVANPAADAPILTPGSLAKLTLATGIASEERATSVPLPVEIHGVSVILDSVQAPLLSAGPDNVVFQVPWTMICGPQAIFAKTGGATADAIYAEIRPNYPTILAAAHTDWQPITEANPARSGEVIALFTTGLGQVDGELTAGGPAPLSPLIPLKVTPVALLNDSPAKTVFAGLAPLLIGLQQLVIEVPGRVTAGKNRLVLLVDGEPGASFPLAVQ